MIRDLVKSLTLDFKVLVRLYCSPTDDPFSLTSTLPPPPLHPPSVGAKSWVRLSSTGEALLIVQQQDIIEALV